VLDIGDAGAASLEGSGCLAPIVSSLDLHYIIPMTSEDQWQRIVKLTTLVILVIAIVFVLKTLRSVFVPLVFAAFLAYLFSPLVELLSRIRVPRLLSFFLILIIVGLLGWFLVQAIVGNIKEFIELYPTIESKLLTKTAVFLKQRFQLEPNSIPNLLRSQRVQQALTSLLNYSFSFFGKFVLIVMILVFYYLSFTHYPKIIRKAFPRAQGEGIFGILRNINKQIITYLEVKTLTSAGTGLFSGLACWAFGVKFGVLWGFLAFMLNYIPYIGSWAAVLMPSLFSLFLFPNSFIPLYFFAVLVGTQGVWGNLLEWEILGSQFNLSPIVIILSLVFWGYVWGVAGAFLAVPLTAIIRIIVLNIGPVKFVGILMSKKADEDRPSGKRRRIAVRK
jgi:AI-2 transport protein TqsA